VHANAIWQNDQLRSLGEEWLLYSPESTELEGSRMRTPYTPGALLVGPFLRVHELVYKATGGVVGKRMIGRPSLLLTTTGRKTGKRREHALVFARDGASYVVVASNGGNDRAPGWLFNLRANADVEVKIGRERFPATARVASGEERERLWEQVNRENRGLAPVFHPEAKGRYDVYQRHTGRSIDVVVLTPTRPSSAS